MHEKGGMDLALKMSSHYSTKQLYDIIEMLDVYDSLKEEAKKRAKQESTK